MTECESGPRQGALGGPEAARAECHSRWLTFDSAKATSISDLKGRLPRGQLAGRGAVVARMMFRIVG